jgi:hypothetical protein
MSAGDEIPVINDFLDDLLGQDTILLELVVGRVHDGLAPANEKYPFIVYQVQAPSLVRGVGTITIMADPLYVVKAIAQTNSYDILRPIVRRMDALLTGYTGVVLGGSIEGIVRTAPYSLIEEVEGRQIRHLGGIYRIQAQAI